MGRGSDDGALLICELRLAGLPCQHPHVSRLFSEETFSPLLTILLFRFNLEGDETPFLYSTLLDRPELRHVGSNTRYAYV